MSVEREPEQQRDHQPGERESGIGDDPAAGQGVDEHTHQMRILIARQRSLRRRQFEELTGIPPSAHSRILVWQVAHGLMPNGKVGKREVEVARLVKASAPPAQAEAGSEQSAPAEASAPTITKVPDTADELVAEADTSHNRHGGEEAVTEELKDALFEAVCLALEKAGVNHAVVAGVAGKVVALARRGKWSQVREEVANYATSPTTVTDILKFVGTKLGKQDLVDVVEDYEPFALAMEAATVHAKIALAIIEKAHRAGDHDAQLRQYAWSWSNQFMRNDFQPSFFPALDEQMELMNTCLRLGVQDANSTRGAMDYEVYIAVRDHLLHHYGGDKQAVQALNDALLKQAAVK